MVGWLTNLFERIAVTGHRPQQLGAEWALKGPYSDFIRGELKKYLLKYTPKQVISGMALGADQLFVQVALELKIPVLAAVPCFEQESKWPKSSKDLYYELLGNSLVTEYVVTPTYYTSSVMQIRNEYMVDNCDLLLAVFNGTRGGTKNCIDYARSIGKPIEFIDPESWRKPAIKDIVLF